METWTQIYAPLGSLGLSALVASLPIIFFFIALAVLRMKGHVAGTITVAIALAIAVLVYQMPVDMAFAAAGYGFLYGLWPIAWIIVCSVFLYKVTVKTGQFDIIRASVLSITEDQRLQMLLVGFSFGAFLEGAAGFGAPVAITAAPCRACPLSVATSSAEVYGTGTMTINADQLTGTFTYSDASGTVSGSEAVQQYLTGYVVEKSLAMDNIFVIALIFTYFAIPAKYQHRVLFWGIIGVIVMRAMMIALGATLVSQFSWVLYLFGAFLIFTGIKMWIIADHMPDIASNPLLKFLKRHLRLTDGLRGNAFWVRENDPATGRVERFATPLLLALALPVPERLSLTEAAAVPETFLRNRACRRIRATRRVAEMFWPTGWCFFSFWGLLVSAMTTYLSFRPCGGSAHPRSGCPCPCRGRSSAGDGCWRRSGRPSACRCP